MEEKRTGNPEAMHDSAHSTEKKVADSFVNPGTPEAALVSRENMTQATLKGNASEVLKTRLIK